MVLGHDVEVSGFGKIFSHPPARRKRLMNFRRVISIRETPPFFLRKDATSRLRDCQAVDSSMSLRSVRFFSYLFPSPLNIFQQRNGERGDATLQSKIINRLTLYVILRLAQKE
jgi:hypothetical protein